MDGYFSICIECIYILLMCITGTPQFIKLTILKAAPGQLLVLSLYLSNYLFELGTCINALCSMLITSLDKMIGE